MVTTWETGIRAGVPAAEYHRRDLGVVSKSALDELHRSPAHYRAWVDGIEPAPTPALRFGTALHMALLEPERFGRTYVVLPDFGDLRSSKNRERRDEWLIEHPGTVALSLEHEQALLGMLESVMRHPTASRLIVDGDPEVTVTWVDEVSGLRCKSRADYFVRSKRLAVDIKSTFDASPRQFARDVYNYRYHVQDALYRMGFAACDAQIDHFAILAIEKEPPYAVAVYTLDEDAVALGYNAARCDIERLSECLAADHWPSYSDGVETLSLPPWAA